MNRDPQAIKQLETLHNSRLRLEVELGGDEHWRALKHSAAEGGAADDPARKARNARLEMALRENPLYLSWKQTVAAIEEIEEGLATAIPAEAPDPSHLPLHEGASELPAHIADEIRRGAVDESDVGPETPSPEPAAADLPPPAVEAADPADESRAKAGIPEASPQADATAEPVVDAGPPETGAATAPEPDADPEPETVPFRVPQRAPADADEASVTFVRREPRQRLLPSAELPSDLGVRRKSPLFERLRGIRSGGEPAPGPYVIPSADADEAEIAIVTPEDKEEQRLEAERAQRVRRFLRALTGE